MCVAYKCCTGTDLPIFQDEKSFALQGPLGVSAVRLIPKSTGFRPIVNLGRRIVDHVAVVHEPLLMVAQTLQHMPGIPISGYSKQMTANEVLRGLHQVLTFEKVC